MSQAFEDLLSSIDQNTISYDPREDRADIDICSKCKNTIIWFLYEGKEAMFDLSGWLHNCKGNKLN